MIGRALLILLFVTYSNCELKKYMNGENYFQYEGENFENINAANDSECLRLSKEKQLYFVSSNYSVKVNCAPKSILSEIYFPKCCPPFHFYEGHKCISTGWKIHEEFSRDVMLVKSGLQHCKVIVDNKNFDNFTVNSDKSIRLNNKIYFYGDYCFDEGLDDNLVVRTCETIDVCMNGDQTCIKKCCPDGEVYKNSCSPAPEIGIQVNTSIFKNAIGNFGIIKSDKCRRYVADESFQYHVERNGSMFIKEAGKIKEYPIEETYYCVEYVDPHKRHEVLLCAINDEPPSKFHLTRISLMISCVCLFLTIVGCCTLQDIKCPIDKVIICYCGSLFASFVTLTWLQFFPNQGSLCVPLGFFISFSLLAAFTWMNILSYDIWCILGKLEDEFISRKFVWYSVLGWCLPIIITMFSIIDRFQWILPEYLHPYVGETKCLIEDHKADGNYGYYLHFVVPCGLLILSNLIIVISTICSVLKTKKRYKGIKMDTYERETKIMILNLDKERIVMVLSIFFVMEANWLFETLSSIIDFKQNPTLQSIENVFDLINCLQGVFIFCIFMLKQRIRLAFTKKIGIYRQLSTASSGTQ